MRAILVMLAVCLVAESVACAGCTRKHRRKAGVKTPVKKTKSAEPYNWERDMLRRGGIPNDGWCIYG